MSYFIFPQGWITPAITAAALAFGSLDQSVSVIYRNIKGGALSENRPPATIIIDKRPAKEWPRERAQCVLAHQYGHLADFKDSTNKTDTTHSDNPNSIMYATLTPKTCHRWLVRQGLSE